MAIIRPPITGDGALDSFLDQIVQELSTSTALAADLAADLLTIDSNSSSATLFLYQRTETNDAPTLIDTELLYKYSKGELYKTVDNEEVLINIIDGWYYNTPPNILDGGYFWQTYVHISSSSNKEIISASSWSTPEVYASDIIIDGIPTPTAPTSISLTQTNDDTLVFSWEFNESDIEHSGLYAEVEARYPNSEVDNEWHTVMYATYPTNSITFTGIASLDNPREFRVRAGNVLTGRTSQTSNTRLFKPGVPTKPINLSIVRKNKDQAVISWEHTNNFSRVQLYQLEVAFDNGVFDLEATAGPDQRSIIISGVGFLTESATYRIRALGLNNQFSEYSDTIDLTAAIPNKPTSLTFIQNSKNEGVLSWDTVENNSLISHYIVEESVGDESNYTFESTVSYPIKQYSRSGLAAEDDVIYFKVKTVSANGFESEYSDTRSFIPGKPNTPFNLAFTRIDKEDGKLTWDYTENFAVIRNFTIEIREAGTTQYTTVGITDGQAREFLINGLSVRSKTFEYRIYAVGNYGVPSNKSQAISVSPSPLVAPTNLSLVALEKLGVVTSVKINWQAPQDSFNQYSTISVQLKHQSETEWRDVATVTAEETSVEFQPSRQGVLSFRLRSNSVNGLSSDYSTESSIYISGGSATDSAIYNGDSAFLASKHYSVNTDDKVMDNFGDVDIISGGTYDTISDKITGQVGTPLVIEWYIDVSLNEVERSRHFYLNVNNLSTVSTNPSPWSIDKNNILVEVLSSQQDTAKFYIDDGTSDIDDFIYTDSGQDITHIRTYSGRVNNGFMYSSREYIILTMARTFTFRSFSRTVIRLTFKAENSEAPVIDLDTLNAIKLEAFASEIMDDTELTVDSLGTVWTFEENFEAPPRIFITPQANVSTWFTDKSSTSVRIHASSSTDVDVTARGR